MSSEPSDIVGRIYDWEIERVYDAEEPQVCARFNKCGELHNGLNKYFVDLGDEFELEMWLCNDCAKAFEERLTKLRLR